MMARSIAMGGMAFSLALVAKFGTPDADALTIVLPAGSGNATQIDILEGNVFDPQFGLEGNGNSSQNTAIGNLVFGIGNNSQSGTTGEGFFDGVIVLGGAKGNGNVTQISILSYNIFNPQFSLDGSNTSNNTAINNVAAGNGNGSENVATSADGAGVGIFGAAIGNGNTTQYALFSGNIFNPQFSLFGDNMSTNTAITNVSMLNGNDSTNSILGSGFGSTLFGAVSGNGNTTQYGGFVSNIFNPQFSLLGKNESHNEATTNHAEGNGNGSDNGVGSGTWGLGNNGLFGSTSGNGNTEQTAGSAGNIFNDQFRLGNEIMIPGMKEPIELPGTGILQGSAEQANAAIAKAVSADKPLGKVASHVKNAVDKGKDAVDKMKDAAEKAMKKAKSAADKKSHDSDLDAAESAAANQDNGSE